jgi:hypothetical protein
MKFFAKYRKAIGAGVGTFLASFPLVGAIDGSAQGDLKVLAAQAGAAAIGAVVTAAWPANASE